MSYNNLGANGPATATALAASPAIHTVDMSRNELGAYGPATAAALAASPTIHTINMSDNELRANGPAAAAALAASPTIHTVDMSENDLGDGPTTATALAASHTIHTVNLRYNVILEHVNDPATASVFVDHNQYVSDLIELTHLICIDVHPVCDELEDLICSYLDVPIDYTL